MVAGRTTAVSIGSRTTRAHINQISYFYTPRRKSKIFCISSYLSVATLATPVSQKEKSMVFTEGDFCCCCCYCCWLIEFVVVGSIEFVGVVSSSLLPVATQAELPPKLLL